jgi:tRNA dimethylallyltransferase
VSAPTTDRIRVIVGPTGAGKSALALELCERFDGAIVSADSRQVYRGFDVGTAKPSDDERRRIPHRGIDVVDPTERYSAAAWADGADRWLGELQSSGWNPVIVGGTGLYLRALFEPFYTEPPLDRERKLALESILGAMPRSELERWCRELDPTRASLGRTQLLRSLEVAMLTGRRLSDLHEQQRRPPMRRARYLVVDPGSRLEQRIRDRAASMLDHEWPAEVERLRHQVPAEAPAWKATGYVLVRQFVEGTHSREDVLEAIVIETRQYAKRQRTWFRHQLPADAVTRIDPDSPEATDAAERWWHEDPT